MVAWWRQLRPLSGMHIQHPPPKNNFPSTSQKSDQLLLANVSINKDPEAQHHEFKWKKRWEKNLDMRRTEV